MCLSRPALSEYSPANEGCIEWTGRGVVTERIETDSFRINSRTVHIACAAMDRKLMNCMHRGFGPQGARHR